MSSRDEGAKAVAGCLVLAVVLAIKAAMLVGTLWLGVWALRAVGVLS